MTTDQDNSASARSSGNPPPDDVDGLISEVYDELHRLAKHYFRRQPPGDTLQTTALVHEAYLRLSSQEAGRWHDRHHFYCVAARAMRQILVNHVRDRNRLKRGGGRKRVSLENAILVAGERSTDLEALDEALERLADYDARKCQVVELRYFGGFTVEETAEILKVSPATVLRDWALARAWLLEAMGSGENDDG